MLKVGDIVRWSAWPENDWVTVISIAGDDVFVKDNFHDEFKCFSPNATKYNPSAAGGFWIHKDKSNLKERCGYGINILKRSV